MRFLHMLLIIPKALRQLGFRPLLFYAGYQFKLRSGLLRLQTPGEAENKLKQNIRIQKIVKPASRKEFEKVLGNQGDNLFAEADEILAGQVRLFGAEEQTLDLNPITPLKHWTSYHSRMLNGEDIKPIWELGRFGWATVLARAYWLSGEERYAEGFWKLTERFFAANPVNMGPQWSSGQEVALRLIALGFCTSLVADSIHSSTERKASLAASLAAHAERIPPTLLYARAQNNNHLLSEALGLYTAAALLPQHRKAADWQRVGRRFFVEGLMAQIGEDGSYVQQSTNYQRLMLQLGMWAVIVADVLGETWPNPMMENLIKATKWLRSLLDEDSGQTPNLGPNDGAYILPLSVLPFEDYRPILQAASLNFLGSPALKAGIWDEMALWFGQAKTKKAREPRGATNQVLRLEGKNSWAYFRVAHFNERPGHADQLHVDLWWRGLNIAQDAGSYLYTAPAPWDNALASTRTHNTVTVNGKEQMRRTGRFLWLDWAQGKVISTRQTRDGKLVSASASHDGYQHLGVIHRREVSTEAMHWVVIDHLSQISKTTKMLRARLHWLLPDWPWQVDTQELRIKSPKGSVEISIGVSVGDNYELQVVRAGELLHGSGPAEAILGWASPTYGVKVPALSFIVDLQGKPPLTITSTFTLPG